MENNIKVSVIIPTYKRADTLDRAINSVLNQSYTDVEVIVVDDNNPDTEGRKLTEEMMAQYDGNPRVTYLKHSHNKNGSAARNTGARWSKAEYVSFLDDDDEFLPNKIESQVKKMESLSEDWGLCYSKYYTRKPGEEPIQSNECKEGSLYFEALIHSVGFCAGSNLLIRKSVFDEVGGFDETFKRSQDHELLTKLLKNYKIAYVDEPGLIVNVHTHKGSYDYEEIANKYIETFKKQIEELPEDQRKLFYRKFNIGRFYHLIAGNKNYRKALMMIIHRDVLFFDVITMVSKRALRVIKGNIS